MTLALAAAHTATAAPHSHLGWAAIGLLCIFTGAFWPRKKGSR